MIELQNEDQLLTAEEPAANDNPLQTPEEAILNCFPREERSSRDTILIVDDDESIRIVARMLVEIALPGFKIIEAPSPKHAVIQLLRHGVAEKIAFVWTDGTMPGMHGIYFARFLRGGEVEEKAFPDSVAQQLAPNHEGSGLVLPNAAREALRNVPIQFVSADEGDLEALVGEGVVDSVVRKPFGIPAILNSMADAGIRMQLNILANGGELDVDAQSEERNTQAA